MKIPIYQIDAFSREPFSGNPAAVCPLEYWLEDALMQKIAAENNLAETVFFVREGAGYRIRWFTPTCEVDLCGHATVAAAYVLWEFLGETAEEISFASLSGPLSVRRSDDHLQLNFPARPITTRIDAPELVQALHPAHVPLLIAAHGLERVLVRYGTAAEIQALNPDMSALKKLPYGVIYATAAGEGTDADFVCRVFAPNQGIDEDPVTGSAYTALTPFWATQMNKTQFFARQLSERGGEVWTAQLGERVTIAGHACCVLTGEFRVPQS